MDEEHDVLDWGAEDDENKNNDASRHGAADARRAEGDNDDVEDSVSLGDEEEEQEYYQYQEETTVTAVDVEGAHASVASLSTGADDEPSTSQGLQREGSSTSQLPSSNAGTPRRTSSTSRRSPQRSLAPRITHALPPKPVVTNVPFLHPSHPSIVEATAMSVATRSAGRSESSKTKVNGASTTTLSTTGNGKVLAPALELEPLPHGWEVREARSGSGGTYFYNSRTQQSTWTRPVSSSSSSHHVSRGDSSRRRRGSNSFTGATPHSPPRSDHPHSQSQEASRHSRRPQSIDHDHNHMTDLQPAAVPDPTGMSYNDRHYRPGGAESAPASGSMSDRDHRNLKEREVDPRFNPRPDQAFTPSPDASPRARERERSLSPIPVLPSASSRGRGSRSSRAPRSSRGGRHDHTDPDSSTHRDRDTVPNSYPARESWDQSNTYQEPRHAPGHHYEMPVDAPVPPRTVSTRGRRAMRQESRVENIPDSRTRSPPPDKHDIRTRDADDARDRDYDRHRPMPPSRGQEGYQMTSNEPPSPQFSAHPPQLQRRDRASRFGQATSLSPQDTRMPEPQLQSEPQPQPPSYPPRPPVEDDPFVPDDIRSPAPNDLEERREVFEKLSRMRARFEAELPRHPRHGRGTEERAVPEPAPPDDRDSSSEQHSRRAPRPPLPPQSAEFQGLSSRPREQPRERPHRQLQDHPPSHSHLNDRDEQSSAGPRDAQRSTHDNLPSRYGQGQGRGFGGRDNDDFLCEDTSETAMVRRRTADIARFPSENADDEETDKLELQARRRSIDMAPPMDLRRGEVEPAGPESYPQGQMYPPRGPRAMSSSVNTSANPNRPPSPVTQTGFGAGPSGRNIDRSPPPHMSGRGRPRDNGEWRDGFASNRGGHRTDRGRPNDFSRPPPASTSGTNSLPIGANKKTLGNGGPLGPPPMRMPGGPPPGMSGMNQRQNRVGGGGGGARGRGGAPHPPRELQFDRGYGGEHGDRFRNGRLESDGPPSRRQEGSLLPFERLGVDTTVSRDRDHFSTSPHERFEPSSADSARLARTWTPRGEPPPEVFIGDDRHPSPVLSREARHVSPVVDTGRPLASRYRDQTGSLRGRPPQQPHSGKRYGMAEESRRLALEGRLGDRFDSNPLPHQTHALPQNPNLLMGPEPLKNHSEARRGKERRQQGPVYQSLTQFDHRNVQDVSHQEAYDVDDNMDGPPHLRSNDNREEYMGRKWRADSRPESPRRPGSLLERLEMSAEGNDPQEESPFSRSLSDRVQVPSKRDRDEINRDRYGPDQSFDGDDTDPTSKKARRKPMRPRKAKRA